MRDRALEHPSSGSERRRRYAMNVRQRAWRASAPVTTSKKVFCSSSATGPLGWEWAIQARF
ncbi:MAG: hypothetical protein U0900_24640, partial [Myxococcota bacterium]